MRYLAAWACPCVAPVLAPFFFGAGDVDGCDGYSFASE